MNKIQLSNQGKNKGKFVALVDDENYEYLNQWKWFVVGHGVFQYAGRKAPSVNQIIRMHRVILSVADGIFVDHIDHNGLNNQKYNLRICTNSENQMNRNKSDKAKYKGVCKYSFISAGRKYEYIRASIMINKVPIRLGYFKTEKEAALAYDNAAKIHHGEFASLNFKTE